MGPSELILCSIVIWIPGIWGGRDWQNCQQFPTRFCNHMCGVSGSQYAGLCSRPGLCRCPASATPPAYCKEPSTFDYHELANCRNRKGLCPGPLEDPAQTALYVCTDLKGKKSELDQSFFRYCVCFPGNFSHKS